MTIQDIKIPANGYSLQGKILRKDASSSIQSVILVIHGWTSQMKGYVDRFSKAVEMGYAVLLFDMRGHGETGGDLTLLSAIDHQDDCMAAFDYIQNVDNINMNNITVYGSSYGGYQAAILSFKRTFHNLILKAPAQYVDTNFDTPNTQRSQETTEYRLLHHSSEDNRALKSLNAFSGNILFVECELDEQVPKQVMDDYRQVISQDYTYELLKDADHSCKNPGTEEAMRAIMNSWLQKHI